MPVTGPLSLNDCPGEELDAPPPGAPGAPPRPFTSAAENATAGIVAMAASDKIFFISLSLGFLIDHRIIRQFP